MPSSDIGSKAVPPFSKSIVWRTIIKPKPAVRCLHKPLIPNDWWSPFVTCKPVYGIIWNVFSLVLCLQLEKSRSKGTWKFVPASFTLPLCTEQEWLSSTTCQSKVVLNSNLCDLDTCLVLKAIILFKKYIHQLWLWPWSLQRQQTPEVGRKADYMPQ